METKVYVDVLLVLNYIINILLILCTGKLMGRRPKRRRMVAAALIGAGGSLTIFLPFFGFWVELLAKTVFSVAIVMTAFPYIDAKSFLKQLLVFFAVSFFFAGTMLGIWIAFSPNGMVYYNGVAYFDINSLTLIATTVVAYVLLSLFQRFSRKGRLRTEIYRATVTYRGRSISVQGLVDTGNGLYEPFSDIPVMVCNLRDIAPLLPAGAAEAILKDVSMVAELTSRYGVPLRFVPYRTAGGKGSIPAFRPDKLTLDGPGGRFTVESVYIGITGNTIKGEGYSALLNPDLVGIKILQGGATR